MQKSKRVDGLHRLKLLKIKTLYSMFERMGSLNIYNFKAYYILADESMQEYKIENFIRTDGSL